MDFRPIIKVENENKQLQAKIKALESQRHKVVKTSKAKKATLIGEKPFQPVSRDYEQVEPLIYQHEELEQIRKATMLETMKMKEEKELFECSFQPQINDKSKEIIRTSSNYVPILERAEYDIETIRMINEKQEVYVEVNRVASRTVSVKSELGAKKSPSKSKELQRTASIKERSVSKSKVVQTEQPTKVSVSKVEVKKGEQKRDRSVSRGRSQSRDKNPNKAKPPSRSKSPSKAKDQNKDKSVSKNRLSSKSKSRDKSASKKLKSKNRSSSKKSKDTNRQNSKTRVSSKSSNRKKSTSKSSVQDKTQSVSSPLKLKKVAFAQ